MLYNPDRLEQSEGPENNIYVLLTNTGTLFTRLIKAFTSAPYNHASLAFDVELKEVYSFGRMRPNNPLLAGFVQENVYDGVYRMHPDTSCTLLRFRVTEQQIAMIKQFVQSIEQNKNDYGYNLLGVIGIMLKVDYNPESEYFCSQFVAEALNRGGLELWDRPSTKVTPEDFRQHPQMEAVYEGLLYDYPLLDEHKVRLALANRTGAVKGAAGYGI
ncbi:hypothetical protein [Paenibacillus harenae]|uniref:hypothetical protein n=1 Tax=Paenibacillus harenae TaxID=306543 RepID=UPI0027928CF8|nr:hypothetical protein [Paenibacillus harenae]MDQ0063103.1 hypothetical protein [Paenibacillus harenae]